MIYPLLATMTVVAQQPLKSMPAQPALSCEALPGEYEKKELAVQGNPVEGRIRLLRPAFDAKWFPAAGLVFQLAGQQTHVGVQVFIEPASPNKLVVGLRRPFDDTPMMLARFPSTATLQVYTQLIDGVLTAGVRSPKPVERSIKLKNATIGSTALMCSSGAFEFELLNGSLRDQDRGSRPASNKP